MPYLRVKWIKGHPYLYEQASYREGGKVKTKHIRYVGKYGHAGSSGVVKTSVGTIGKTVSDDKLSRALRLGEIDENGAYFSTPGSSTYYDPDTSKQYDLSGVQVADTTDKETTLSILSEALKDPKNTASDTKRIRQAIIFNTDEKSGFIDYLLNDEVPSIVRAAKKKGYDGIAVTENDDLPGDASSVFVWNIPPEQAPVGDMTDLLLNKITGVKQSADDFADYMQSDGQTVKAIVDDFIDYATVSTKSDAEVNSIVGSFISRGDDAIVSYKQSIGEYKGLRDSESLQTVAEMNSALSEFTSQLDKLKSAKTRTDKVVALDSLIPCF